MTEIGEPEDPDLVAAEYVLGTLDRDERGAFAQRLRQDERARRSVRNWERRFAGLSDRLEPVAPPASLWPSIERAISGGRSADLRVIEGGGRAPSAVPGLQASRNRWRAAALVLGTLAAALVGALTLDVSNRGLVAPQPSETYVAAINRGGDKPALLVRVDLATRNVFVMPVAAEVPPDRSLELWYIGDDKTPKAMGLIEKTRATVQMPAGAQATGATFAVSVEPPGGSRTGGPTGPVVYSGQLVRE